MKKRIISFILPLIFILSGLFVGVVPVVIPLVYQAENNDKISEYSEKVSRLTEDEREEVAHEMKTYNNGGRSNFYTALDNETVISYIDIPKINVYLPVYKGTDDATLDRGIGIMENTSLPIGGMGSHCVLSGHSGLTLRTMFNSLDQLEVGDCFYLHTYGYTLSYRIYAVRTVLPNEVLFNISKDEQRDLCTLMTCTPQGVNTHRLLVMGERTTEPTVISRQQPSTALTTEETTAQPLESTTTEPVQLEKPRQVFPFTATMIVCSIISVALEVLGVICIICVCKTIRKKDGGNECNTR